MLNYTMWRAVVYPSLDCSTQSSDDIWTKPWAQRASVHAAPNGFCLVLIPTQTRTRNIFWQLESWIVSTLLATLSWLAILKGHLYLKNWEYLYENGSMGLKDYVRDDTVVENHWFFGPTQTYGSVYPACRQLPMITPVLTVVKCPTSKWRNQKGWIQVMG